MRRPDPVQQGLLDPELADLPPQARWREWMGRVEAVIFASAAPVGREALARLVGRDCDLDRLIADIRAELANRPYDLVAVAGGWQHRTRPAFGPAVRAMAAADGAGAKPLTPGEAQVLAAIAFFQPVTRAGLAGIFGREISRDLIAALKARGFVAAGPRAPAPGAPLSYVTTPAFLSAFGFETLRDLPDLEALEDAGLIRREAPPAGDDGEEEEEDGEGSGTAINHL